MRDDLAPITRARSLTRVTHPGCMGPTMAAPRVRAPSFTSVTHPNLAVSASASGASSASECWEAELPAASVAPASVAVTSATAAGTAFIASVAPTAASVPDASATASPGGAAAAGSAAEGLCLFAGSDVPCVCSTLKLSVSIAIIARTLPPHIFSITTVNIWPGITTPTCKLASAQQGASRVITAPPLWRAMRTDACMHLFPNPPDAPGPSSRPRSRV